MKVSRFLARALSVGSLCLLLALVWGTQGTPGLAAQAAPGKTEDSLVARQMAAFAACPSDGHPRRGQNGCDDGSTGSRICGN